MIFEIEITEHANANLRSIYEYIAFELNASESASKLLATLERAIMSLEHIPYRHKLYEYSP